MKSSKCLLCLLMFVAPVLIGTVVGIGIYIGEHDKSLLLNIVKRYLFIFKF
jgi:hypothetical protein